jgi:TrmH family RNA methyltransferase
LKEVQPNTDMFGLILGNEGQGVRDTLLDLADEIVTIPMTGTESLNVGVAGSIIMYQLASALKQ